MYIAKNAASLRVKLALRVSILAAATVLTACASDPRSGDQRREDARTCARLGTTGSGTVTCMMLQPRERERREREQNGY